jgi:acyl-CoA thioesterase-1
LAFFSYTDIQDGFSGFFNTLQTPGSIKFSKDSVFYARIKGTQAFLNCSAGGATPYIVIVDDVVSTPSISGGRIELFSGLIDYFHDVTVIVDQVYANSFNEIDTSDTQILEVIGSSPEANPIKLDYLNDPGSFLITSEPKQDAPGGDFTPTYPQSYLADERPRGMTTIKAQCSEIAVFTGDSQVWYTVDKGTPILAVANIGNNLNSQDVRRVLRIEGLDNTQTHEYNIWGATQETYPISGIACIDSNDVVVQQAPDDRKFFIQFGDSITYGTGATPGEADSFIYGNALGVSVLKAGWPGDTTAQITSKVQGVLDASQGFDYVVVAAGRNNGNDATFVTEYQALIDLLQSNSVPFIIARGVLPNPTNSVDIIGINDKISTIVDGEADPKLVYVDPTEWTDPEITTVDLVHPNANGYSVAALSYQVPVYTDILESAIIGQGFLNKFNLFNFIQGGNE